MKKYITLAVSFSIFFPLLSFALSNIPPVLKNTSGTGLTQSGKMIVPSIKKRIVSGELRLKRQNAINSMSGKTSTGRIVPQIGAWSGTLVKPKQKSALELAAERQRQREADLENQHKEQQEAEDKQRAKVVAEDLKKAAEERARQAELQKQQDSETIELYCARAERQGFLKSKWNVDTVAQCIDKLNALKRLGKRIMDQAMESATKKRKTLEDALKKRCLEAISNNRPVPAACRRLSNAGSTSGSGTTQTGSVLTTTR